MSFKIDTNTVMPIVIPDATQSAAGVMSAADKVKLDSLAPGGDSFQSINDQPSGNSGQATAPGAYADMPLPALTFTAPTDGVYAVDVIIKALYSNGAGGIGSFQITLDGFPIALSETRYPFDTGAYVSVFLDGRVSMTEGDHQLQVQWKEITGTVLFDGVVGGQAFGSRRYIITSVD